MKIVLLSAADNCPAYTVDFDNYKASKVADLNTLEKAQACALHSFHLIGIFFVSLKDSAWRTLGNSGTSFKYIVLGYYGSLSKFHPPKDIYLAVFKIVFWVAAMGWGVIATTFRLFMERSSPGHTMFLKTFTNGEIDVDHIKTEELELDASSVPETIKVDALEELFDKINFTDEDAPGYMPPTTRRGVSIDKLKKDLGTFIKNINTRKAFIGTPPAYDVPRLMAFYQQIEDAVRLAIQKATDAINKFETENGTNFALFNDNQKREYKNLLEIRARVALDLAIAGSYCGARYMGEAMEVYYSIYGEGVQNDKDLQGTLIEILAEKRKEIARGHIEGYMGTDVHTFTKYMGNMGKFIGIPGTKNIIEHLSQSFDTHRFLSYFFQDYTVDTIIDTIQEKIKTSQAFREKITDWIRDQVKDWNQERYEDIDGIVNQIKEIRDRDNCIPEKTPLILNFEILQELLANVEKKDRLDLPKISKEDWNLFIEELFALHKVKEGLEKIFYKEGGDPYSSENNMNRQIALNKWKNNLKQSCFKTLPMLETELLKKLQEAIVSDTFIPISAVGIDQLGFTDRIKIEDMKKVLFGAEEETLSRVLALGDQGLVEAVKDYQNLARRNAFLACFALEDIAANGISKELMEWLLVSQKILTPQAKNELESREVNIDPAQAKDYIRVVHQGFYANLSTPEKVKNQISLETLYRLLGNENMEKTSEISACVLASTKRYSQSSGSKKEKVLTWIFNQSFEYNSDKVIAAAEKASNKGKAFYPQWKTVSWIQLPKIPADLFSYPLFKIALVVSSVAISAFSIYQAQTKVAHFFAAKGIPFIINHVPAQIIRAGNAIMGTKDFVWNHSIEILAATWLIRAGVERLPRIPYLSAAIRSINIWSLFHILFHSPQTIGEFAFHTSFDLIKGVWNVSQEISLRFRRISQNSEKERLAMCKQKSLDVWRVC